MLNTAHVVSPSSKAASEPFPRHLWISTRASRPVWGGLPACLIGWALVLPACATKKEAVYVGDASSPILATQSFGALEVTLPEPLPVRAVIAAAEACVRDRGYTITQRRTTDEAARIVAQAPARELGREWALGRQWIVEARATADGRTGLSVDPGGWDDEAGAEVLMDAILRRLGR